MGIGKELIKNSNKKAIAISTIIAISTATSVLAANQTHVDQLIKTKECSECDLPDARLAGADLIGANVRDADLRKADLRGAKLD